MIRLCCSLIPPAELFFLVIAERKLNPIDKNDLLNIMLNGEDKETGAKLSEESIGNNVRLPYAIHFVRHLISTWRVAEYLPDCRYEFSVSYTSNVADFDYYAGHETTSGKNPAQYFGSYSF